VQIRQDNLTGKKIAAFLQEHIEEMHNITPPESVHALDLEELRSPNITFWSVWEGDELLGCGALKQLDPKTGEIKSMRTAYAYRRKGIASKILESIITEAITRNYNCLKLETGSFAEFAAARALYLRYGFEYCPPFAEYINDPNSVFMAKNV
jgi:putative acetyltransferase